MRSISMISSDPDATTGTGAGFCSTGLGAATEGFSTSTAWLPRPAI